MLTLQTGRYLLGCFKAAVKDKKKVPIDYINRMPLKAKASGDPVSLECIAEAFDSVSANLLVIAGKAYMDALTSNNEDAALEKCSLQRFKTAKAHCQGYLFHKFRDGIKKAPGDLVPVLSDLCQLYGLYTINENTGPFLQFGYYCPEHIQSIQAKVPCCSSNK